MTKSLRYLSLAKKAGKLVIGAEDCAAVLNRKKGNLAVLAADAGGNTAKLAKELTDAANIPLLTVPCSKLELSGAIGRNSGTAIVVVNDRGFARAFSEALQIELKQEEHI